MSLVAATTSRVAEHTAGDINLQIQQEIEANVAYFAERPYEIDDRLAELDHEWDIERVLEANAASVSLLGLMLDRRWLALPVGVTAFLLQHAVQGWCPPIPLFRRLGVRTAAEIDQERYALKALRGHFENIAATAMSPAPARARATLEAVRADAH